MNLKRFCKSQVFFYKKPSSIAPHDSFVGSRITLIFIFERGAKRLRIKPLKLIFSRMHTLFRFHCHWHFLQTGQTSLIGARSGDTALSHLCHKKHFFYH